MRNYKIIIAQILSAVIFLTSIIVIIGWFLDISVLTSIHPDWVTMKFSTALCFLASSIILYFFADYRKKNYGIGSICIPNAAFIIALFMVTTLASYMLDLPTGVESLFVKELEGAALSVSAGVPSFGTVVLFLIISFLGLFHVFNQVTRLFIPSGAIISLASLGAIMGYILRIPALYFHIESISTAMAFHTSILFLLLGIGLLLLGEKK